MPKSKKRTKSAAKPAKGPALSRRSLLGGGVAATAAVGGIGFWGMGSFRAYAAEHDLTKVGQGSPTIVQIHDPQCPICTSLQRETRQALGDMDDCGMVYLVADIKTDKGAAFARKYAVPHVTLLLFDGAGELQETVRGMQQSEQLAGIFAAHKAATA